MAQREEAQMNVKSSVASGDPMIIARFQNCMLQVWGVWSASLQIQGAMSVVGDLADIGGPITANGFVSLPPGLQRIAVKTTAYVSGTPKVTFAGTDPV